MDREQVRRDAEEKLAVTERERGVIYAALIRGDGCCRVNDADYSREFWDRAMDRLAGLEKASRERDEAQAQLVREYEIAAALEQAEARLAAVPALVETARQYLDTGRGDLDGALAAYEEAQEER